MEIDFVNAIQEKSVSQLIQLLQGVESSRLEEIISKLSTFPVIGGSSLMVIYFLVYLIVPSTGLQNCILLS